MNDYRKDNILISMHARIHPADKNIPDCICTLALSERHLYVVEDNYDGTYTEHYDIDVRYIEDMRISAPNKTEKEPAPGSAAALNKEATDGVFILGRFFKAKGPKKYLEVIYKDDEFAVQHLFFDECDIKPQSFVDFFHKVVYNGFRGDNWDN